MKTTGRKIAAVLALGAMLAAPSRLACTERPVPVRGRAFRVHRIVMPS